MLINVTSDKEFQRFLDRREQRLHVELVPMLATGIRMTVRDGSHNAQEYIVKRGQNVLVAHYKRIFREMYGSVAPREEKAENEGIMRFMAAQLDYIRTEAARSITQASHSLVEAIRQTVFRGVQEGKSNDQIARELYADTMNISRDRAATIARTETHGAAMWALDETLDAKEIEVRTKRWWTAGDNRVRPSHRAMHDVAIPRDEPFELEGGQMMFPGDDSMGVDPGEFINCRCSILYETA